MRIAPFRFRQAGFQVGLTIGQRHDGKRRLILGFIVSPTGDNFRHGLLRRTAPQQFREPSDGFRQRLWSVDDAARVATDRALLRWMPDATIDERRGKIRPAPELPCELSQRGPRTSRRRWADRTGPARSASSTRPAAACWAADRCSSRARTAPTSHSTGPATRLRRLVVGEEQAAIAAPSRRPNQCRGRSRASPRPVRGVRSRRLPTHPRTGRKFGRRGARPSRRAPAIAAAVDRR